MPPGVDPMSRSMFADISDGTTNTDTYGGASYRSVAFGTWKVGEARRFTAERFAKRHKTPEPISSSSGSSANCQTDKRPANNKAQVNKSPIHHKSKPEISATQRVNSQRDATNENRTSPIESHASSSSRSQPCSPLAARHSAVRARLAEQEEEMSTSANGNPEPNGDFYSSTEYVRFATAKNAYENVILGANSPLLCRQSLLLNRSMDALNERIVHQFPLNYQGNPTLHHHHQNFDQQQATCSSTTSSSSMRQTGSTRGTLGRNWRAPIRPPMIMQREYVVDPGPIGSSAAYSVGANGSHHQHPQRYRAKSLDNTNRVNTTTLPTKLRRAGSKQPEDPNNKSALQSAKNFLRRLYNTSTLRLRRSGHKMDAEKRFQIAMAPFYEPRRPAVEERPYLPYNIRYEIEIEEDEGTVYDSHLLNTPPSSTASSSTASTAVNHTSPDEGMFSESSSSASTRSSALSNGLTSASSRPLPPALPLPNNNNNPIYQQQQQHRPGSGLSSSTIASSAGLNSTFSSSFATSTAADNTYQITSPKRQTPILVERFRNWNELFDHLKKEMIEMRERDGQILRNLKAIEEELDLVKQTAAI